jgi:hypothetical protein
MEEDEKNKIDIFDIIEPERNPEGTNENDIAI